METDRIKKLGIYIMETEPDVNDDNIQIKKARYRMAIVGAMGHEEPDIRNAYKKMLDNDFGCETEFNEEGGRIYVCNKTTGEAICEAGTVQEVMNPFGKRG